MKLTQEERERIKQLNQLSQENYLKKLNLIQFSKNETIEHLVLKTLVCHHLAKNGEIFITEVRLEGSRMDIYSITTGLNVEVLATQELPRSSDYYSFATETKNIYTSDILNSDLLEDIAEKLERLL